MMSRMMAATYNASVKKEYELAQNTDVLIIC